MMKTVQCFLFAVLAIGGSFPLLGADEVGYLPEKPSQVIRANFPDAKVTKINRERERGAWYYEVVLNNNERRLEVEVSPEGVIGEIEGKVEFKDLPAPLQQKVRDRVGRGKLVRVERHERRGVARSGKFVALHQPRISYEIKYYNEAGERRELQLLSDQVLELPETVKKVVAERFPQAKIAEAEVEDDEGVLLYSLSLRQDKEWFTAVVSQDAQLVEYEELIAAKDLPDAALQALHKERDWKKSESTRYVALETSLQVVDGKLEPLHDRTYMVTIHRGKEIKEYRFDGRGRETDRTDWFDASDDDGDEDDEGDN